MNSSSETSGSGSGAKPRLSREEIAAIEVGHTEIRRGPALFLAATFLLLIGGVPLAQTGFEWSAWRRQRQAGALPNDTPLRQATSALAAADIWPGVHRFASVRGFADLGSLNAGMLEEMDRFETRLENDSLLQKAFIPPVQWALTGWLKAGNENAYCGRDGWLFFRPGLDFATGRGFLDPFVLQARARSGNEWTAPPQPDPLQAIVDFRNQLRARDVALVVMPVPVKPMIYPEKFSRRFDRNDRPLRNPSCAAFLAALRAEAIPVYDAADLLFALKSELPDGSFLRTDTHWTPAAMRRCAGELARFLEDTVPFAQPADDEPVRQSVSVTRHGDILDMLKLPGGQTFYEPQTVGIEPVSNPAHAPWTPDPAAEILLLGDSFSNIYSLEGMGWGANAGFAEQLAAEARRPVDRIALNDNGAFATRQELAADLARGNDRLAGKKVVVWQFAARELAVGDWKLIEMRLPQPSAREKPQPTAGVIVEGVLRAMPAPPVPGAVPYRDAIVGMHLQVAAVKQGDFDIVAQPDILVYAWVMRDNVLTPTARFRPGRRLTLSLAPWEAVRVKHGGYNRLELDDPMLLLLDPYWAETVK